MRLVLDGVSHLALLISRPWMLRPDMVKLDWSPRLAGLAAEDRLRIAEAIARIGPEAMVLRHCDGEAALRWGLAHGIRRFQGRQVEAMLTAQRMLACRHAAGCSLRQCGERGGATGPAGRAGCRMPALLDGAVGGGAAVCARLAAE
jgi:hypothetical protein